MILNSTDAQFKKLPKRRSLNTFGSSLLILIPSFIDFRKLPSRVVYWAKFSFWFYFHASTIFYQANTKMIFFIDILRNR